MDKLKMQTKDLAKENYKKLVALFPNALTEKIVGYDEDGNAIVERAIDADVLRQEISSDVIEGKEERYQFTWPDKKRAMVLANTSTSKTLRLERSKSVGRDGTIGSIDTENVYIEGDNLDVLKILRETYLGKVKLIYIDPPYNTGNDFIYNDYFIQSSEEYLSNSGQFDEDGNMLVPNTESNGRFHTDWLNVLYPRLKVSRDILSEDGVIFVSIDEHEIENCLKLLDDVYGRGNRIGVIVVKSNPRGSMSIGEIANLHEYLAVYSKNITLANVIGHKLTENMESEYKYSDEKGTYRLLGLRMRGGFWRRTDRPNLYYPIYVNPNTCAVSLTKDDKFIEEALPVQPSTMEDGTWRWSVDKVKQSINELIGKKIKRGEEEVWDIYQKDYYEREGGRRTKAKSIWDAPEINYQNGTTELKELFGEGVFDYSKPVYLLSQILEMIGLENDDVIMDFFSGSATTAQAVMEYNQLENKSVKYIMVQLKESCDDKRKGGSFKTICEIGEERIRRAGEKIKKTTGADIDYGFRVFALDSTNMKEVYYSPAETQQSFLSSFADNIKDDRTPEDLLFQVMLESNVMLSSKIEEMVIGGKRVFNVADGFLIACFDVGVTNQTIEEMAKKRPYYAVLRDSGMENDSVATNFDQIFETYSPDTVRKIL